MRSSVPYDERYQVDGCHRGIDGCRRGISVIIVGIDGVTCGRRLRINVKMIVE